MLDGIPAWVGNGSPWALIALFVVLIYTGRLVARAVHEDAVKAKAEEADRWHTAYQAEREIRRELVEDVNRLADGQEVLVKALRDGLSAASQVKREEPS